MGRRPRRAVIRDSRPTGSTVPEPDIRDVRFRGLQLRPRSDPDRAAVRPHRILLLGPVAVTKIWVYHSALTSPIASAEGQFAMQMVGLVIVWVVSIGIIGIGIAYVVKSERNAVGFGLPRLPERDARGWWQVKGVRDIVSGVLLIVAIFAAGADLWWLILVLSLIPLGDAVVILTNGGRKSAAVGIHGTTAVGMIIAGLLLARG
ncbi:MAG: DUF4267 domain-containing protein [Steroidobacteraceae bacterium]